MIFAAVVMVVVIWVAVSGFRQRNLWNGAVTELRDVSQDLEALFGALGHRELYRSYALVREALVAASQRHLKVRWVLEVLLPALDPYHHRAIAGAGSAWNEIRNSFFEKTRHIVRLTRAAAGWVVLIGLAGTVFGFMEAMPALREVLAPSGAQATTSQPQQTEQATGPSKPERSEAATVAGHKLYRVLGSLQGVFVATFAGVLGALLLSWFNLLFFEPAFDRFAESVDHFGARWLDPLVHAPDTLIDDALRSELRTYFEEIGRKLEGELRPLVSRLRVSLEEMSGLTTSFSGNISDGAATLKAFHAAVHALGSSAAGAVGQVQQIVEITGKFVQEVGDLQQTGVQRLSDALAGPTASLADAAAAMQSRVDSLHSEISSLTVAIDRHSGGEEALRQSLVQTAESLEGQLQTTAELHGAVATLGPDLGRGLAPLFDNLSRDLTRSQEHLTSDSRKTLQVIATGVDAIREMLDELRTLRSPERLREERQGLEALQRAVEGLRDGIARNERPGSRSETSPGRDNLEQVSLLREIRGLLQTSVDQREAPHQGWLRRVLHRDDDGQGTSRLLRWLGFGRGEGK